MAIGQEAVPTLYEILNSSWLAQAVSDTIDPCADCSCPFGRNNRRAPCSSCGSRYVGGSSTPALRLTLAHPAHRGPSQPAPSAAPIAFTSSSNRSARTRNAAGLPHLPVLLMARGVRLCSRSGVSDPRPARPARSSAPVGGEVCARPTADISIRHQNRRNRCSFKPASTFMGT